MAVRLWLRGLIVLGSTAAASAAAAGCSKDDSSPSAQSAPEPADDSEDQSAAFFVELLHRKTYPFLESGRFDSTSDVDAGSTEFEFEFESPPDGRLSIVLARDPADGRFLGLTDRGLPLFDDGVPREGEQSAALVVYALEPGDGGEFRVAATREPTDAELLLESVSDTGFRATLSVAPGFAAGMFTVHRPPGDMFKVGQAPDAELAAFALDADASYFRIVERGTNFSSLVAPGLFVLHRSGEPLFSRGERDRAFGLERLAEDGNPFPLVKALKDTLQGIDAFPEAKIAYEEGAQTKESSSYSFVLFAEPGDRLSIAGMLAQTNDLFVATAPRGIPLFEDGEPIGGEFTNELFLWDAGTEVNERPGYGPHQATRQSKPNSGQSENEPIDRVADGYVYPPLSDLLVLTISGG
jgi:hypothetical protein